MPIGGGPRNHLQRFRRHDLAACCRTRPLAAVCGIAGMVRTDGTPVSPNDIRAMTTTLRHRGPDGEGFWSSGGVGLGHRRLSILDLTSRAQQPMCSGDGRFVISYNGELYNWRQLRRELEQRGVSFVSQSDTEVVLQAFRTWGPGCLRRFNGMFAFIIWDVDRQRLFAARDRYGMKPLYYQWTGRQLLLGSEVKALLAVAGGVRVDTSALAEYFAFQNVLTDRTLFDGIRLLPPATLLELHLPDPGSFRLERWWDFRLQPDDRGDMSGYVEELDRLFRRAVELQAEADVEVGAYLSGGIDSGAVTCMAARVRRQLKTFTGGFDLSSASGLELGFDERAKAGRLSAAYGTTHHEVVLRAGDMEAVLPELVWHLEDLRVGQSYPNFYLARLAARHVKVVLSGIGGDEIFAGYPWRYYSAVRSTSPGHFVAQYYASWQRLLPPTYRATFLRPRDPWDRPERVAARAFHRVLARQPVDGLADRDFVNRSLYFELSTFLHGLLLVEDKLSMAHGLETRAPFLDNALVDFALTVPVRHKLRHVDRIGRLDENDLQAKMARLLNEDGDGKLVLREALSRYVPAGYAFGRKQGFSAPDASWFKGPSIAYIRSLLHPRTARLYDFIDPDATIRVLDEHTRGHTNHRLLIWSLLCFEWWLRIFRDGERPTLSP